MIDVSDGLGVDLYRLLEASGVGCSIASGAIPVDADLEMLAGAVTDLSLDATALALTGGEDFELLFTIGEGSLDGARTSLAELGCEMSVLGKVTDGARLIGERDLSEWKEAGWDHLRSR